MTMTALQIAQEFTKRNGLPSPATLTGATDDLTRQIWGLMNEGLSYLVQEYDWQQLTKVQTFNHANGADYLALDLAGLPNFDHIILDTFWDTTARLIVNGPLNEREWSTLTTMLISQARYSYRLKAGGIYIFGVPTVPASVNFRFEYVSKYAVLKADGITYEERYSEDSGTPILPDKVILADLKWRFRREKSLPYAEDQKDAESIIANQLGREPNANLTLDPDPDRVKGGPTLLVAAGNWPV